MGTWGTGILSDDIAADVSERFTDLIADGLSSVAATKRLLAEYAEELDDPDDGIVVWLALAASQQKLGRLTARVKNKAIRIIDTDADIVRWSESSNSEIRERKRNLFRLRHQLTGDQPKPKKLRSRMKSTTRFRAGDVFTYQLTSHTRVRMCVLYLSRDLGGTYANVSLLGLDDGKPFTRSRLTSKDILGLTYSMIYREPDDRIAVLRRGVALPSRVPKVLVMANGDRIWGHACTWNDFPDVLRKMIRKLGWKTSRARDSKKRDITTG
jgi:hypothetical protein